MAVSRSATVRCASNKRSTLVLMLLILGDRGGAAPRAAPLVEGERARPAEYECGQRRNVEEVGLVAWRPELRPGLRHSLKLNRAEAVRKVHSDRGDQQDHGERKTAE